LRRIILLLALVITIGVDVTCIAQSRHTAQRPAQGDIDFVRKASEAGLTDIELSKLADTHGDSTKVKKFAEAMLAEQSETDDELARIAGGRGLQVATAPAPEQQQWLDQLQSLSAADFDRQFSDLVVKDHRQIIGLFELEATHGQDDDLRAFAQKILPALKDRAGRADDLPPL
jgi:putative membrane protein